MESRIFINTNSISIDEYTSYRQSVERILGGAYISALANDQQLAMYLTSYMVHSYLEGRPYTECAMKIKELFPMRSNA